MYTFMWSITKQAAHSDECYCTKYNTPLCVLFVRQLRVPRRVDEQCLQVHPVQGRRGSRGLLPIYRTGKADISCVRIRIMIRIRFRIRNPIRVRVCIILPQTPSVLQTNFPIWALRLHFSKSSPGLSMGKAYG